MSSLDERMNKLNMMMCATSIVMTCVRFTGHIVFPILFLTPVMDGFIQNITDYIPNATDTAITYCRTFYIYLLFQNIFVGILDLFLGFVNPFKPKALIATGQAVYSLAAGFFYLLLYFSSDEYEHIDLQFFLYVGFSEVLSLIVWIAVAGLFVIHEILTKSHKVGNVLVDEFIQPDRD